MRKVQLLILTLILALLAGAAFVFYKQWFEPKKYARLKQKIINGVIGKMDDERLAGQVIHIAMPGTALTDASRQMITAIKPGGIIFFGFNLESAGQISRLTADLQKLAAEAGLPPFLISTDQEGGYVRRVRDGVLQTPPAMNLGDTRDAELCRATGYHVSRDLGKLGINVFFAPIVDINNNPQNPVIGLRSFGTTPEAVLGCALPFEAGAREAHRIGGAMPVIKHFPGHGDTQTDSHWALPVINKPIDQLRQFELVPFREAIKAGTSAVMTAHILYPQIDPDAPATLSSKWLTQTLRQELGFRGVVFTDAMEMSAVSKHYATVDRPVTAITAGADILLYTSWQDEPPEAKKRILEAIKSGALGKERGNGENPPALLRAVENQITAKLPYIDPAKYLSADEATWYIEYGHKRMVQQKLQPIAYDEEALRKKYEGIRWSAAKKKGGPIWLAGQKNRK